MRGTDATRRHLDTKVPARIASGAGIAVLGFLALILNGCSAGNNMNPAPTPSVNTVVSQVTVIVTYEGNVRPGTHMKFTSPREINGAVTGVTKCRFYGLAEANQGGLVAAEIHLLVPANSLQSTMAAIWALPGVTDTQVTSEQDFTVPPHSLGSVDGPIDCAKASGEYAG